MTVKSGAAWSGLVVCKDDTGALSTPTVGPVGALYVDGAVNGASVTITGSNPYKWTVTLPSLTAGQRVSMYITATIDSVATASVVAEESADTSIASDLAAALVTAQADLDNPAQYKADVSALATSAALTTHDGKLDTVDANVDAILADTGTDGVVVKAAGLAADAVAEIADGVWDELIAGHTTAGSMADELSDVDEDVWAYATRTTTTAPSSSVADDIDECSQYRGDTWVISLTVGAITGYSKLWFTVKEDPETEFDPQALVQIEKTAGLLYINKGAAVTAANGSIAVSSEATGAIIVTVDEAETAKLPIRKDIYFDVRWLASGVVTTKQGTFNILATSTRAVA